MRNRRWTRAAAVAVLSVWFVVGAGVAPASAATQIGRTGGGFLCSPGYQWIQATSDAASFQAPALGRLTRWKIAGSPDQGTVRFQVWRRQAGNDFKLQYTSAPTNVGTDLLVVPLDPKVRVRAGDYIGLRAETAVRCAKHTGASTDTYWYNIGPAPVEGDVVSFTGPECCAGYRFNIAAVFVAIT
jgi:hypothetical protein